MQFSVTKGKFLLISNAETCIALALSSLRKGYDRRGNYQISPYCESHILLYMFNALPFLNPKDGRIEYLLILKKI